MWLKSRISWKCSLWMRVLLKQILPSAAGHRMGCLGVPQRFPKGDWTTPMGTYEKPSPMLRSTCTSRACFCSLMRLTLSAFLSSDSLSKAADNSRTLLSRFCIWSELSWELSSALFWLRDATSERKHRDTRKKPKPDIASHSVYIIFCYQHETRRGQWMCEITLLLA